MGFALLVKRGNTFREVRAGGAGLAQRSRYFACLLPGFAATAVYVSNSKPHSFRAGSGDVAGDGFRPVLDFKGRSHLMNQPPR